MAEYNFLEIEKKWQSYWQKNGTYKTSKDSEKPKFYVLDMFPYPSGAGLHVGHPMGYIATDIVSRYKRLKGFNVLHPMGFDSFGLPAEQYAIKTGQHPALTTDQNIARFKEQMSILGFSYDWDKELRTSDASYYKWTQWIFLKLFNCYYDSEQDKACPIDELKIPDGLSTGERESFINKRRLAYQDEIMVNWCPALGTVLANEEVVGGVSERGGYPVIRKPMRQWMLRITAYADRLIDDLDELDWPESIKTSQRNWIGRSTGAEIDFRIKGFDHDLRVFTTRPDTLYGATYMVIAPEHPFVNQITTEDQQRDVQDYVEQAALKSDLERTELDKTKTGVFTGAYAINPINKEEIPIWISDYVLISYGTGAIMAVPGGDQRDFDFAKKFEIPIVEVISPSGEASDELIEAYPGDGKMLNSGEYNGMDSQAFKTLVVEKLEQEGIGKTSVNYKLRDWVFTRQRYWGEPIPVIHTEDGQTLAVDEKDLPITLPEVESYTGTGEGESPLAKVSDWVNVTLPNGKKGFRETNTMPQWAGSCWYYLRFINPDNQEEMVNPSEEKYWMPVDLYMGGAEHAVLHLLYARFWHKVLFDQGYVQTKEPFQKLVNQGMIQGRSNFVYRIKGKNTYVSYGLHKNYDVSRIHVDISIVKNDVLDVNAFRKSRADAADAEFILEDGVYNCGWEIEKMSKSKYNVVNPDDLVQGYGADTFRMYEMFLGPIEQSKPWNTNGIEGVFKFLRKFWSLFHDNTNEVKISDEKATDAELKVLHGTIKKIEEDVNRLSLNTSVSNFMIATNELTALKCNKREILEPFTIMLSPFAPHLAEELWHVLGHNSSVCKEDFPELDESFLHEDTFEYPVSINGKMRTKLKFPVDMVSAEIESQVLADEVVMKWTAGKPPKKIIIVPKRIINVVI